LLMRELGRKEIINLRDGASLGFMDRADLVIEEKSGRIQGILIPAGGGMFNFGGGAREIWVPWEAVKKIGSDLILVDHRPETGR